MFYKHKKDQQKKFFKNKSKVVNKNPGGVTIKLNNSTPVIPQPPKIINPRITRIPKIPKNFNNRMMYRPPPMIKKINDSDGGINIVLKK